MGQIKQYSCKCGYEKRVFAGGGLFGCNVKHIAKFLPEEVVQFQKEREEGRVKSYIMENELFSCSTCQEIMELPVFSYKRKDGYTCRFQKNCPDCGGAVSVQEDEENPACPKCGLRMRYEVLGDWD